MKSARLLALSVSLLALPASATAIDLGLGADYWGYDYSPYCCGSHGMLQLTLGLRGPLARHLSLGGRFGALVTNYPTLYGAPLDLELRAHVAQERVYLAGYVGPWFLFNSGTVLRVHGAFGFGLNASWVSLGLEVGWLDPSPIIGFRVAFKL